MRTLVVVVIVVVFRLRHTTVPALYADTQAGLACSPRSFGFWVLRGFYQGAVIFFVMVVYSDMWLLGGHAEDQQMASTGAYMCLLTVQALTLYIESHTITLINHIVIVGSWFAFFVFMALLSALLGVGSWPIVCELVVRPVFWLALLVATAAALLPVIAARLWVRIASPPLHVTVQRIEALPAPIARHALASLADSTNRCGGGGGGGSGGGSAPNSVALAPSSERHSSTTRYRSRGRLQNDEASPLLSTER